MNLIADFLKQCRHSPNQLAFSEEDRQLSYAEFKQRVENLAFFLQQHRNTQQPIAIFLDRGIEAAIAIYAVLTIGGIYLPLDVKNPPARLEFIIADAQTEFVIGKGKRPNWLSSADNWLDITQVSETNQAVAAVNVSPKTIAAILYTSGSTGFPKGVALSHAAIWNFADWAAQTFKLNAQDKIASLAPFHFDLSVFDLFSSLSCGASVYFIPARLTLSPSRLVVWLSKQQISSWYTVPSLLSFIAFKGGLESTPLPFLKQLLFAGEVFPTPALSRLAQLLPDVAFYNLYGPTETNVCCYWQVDRTRLQADQSIPIGVPACGAELEIAANGELWVKCLNNFSGYWQHGKLIRRNSGEAYGTGDKVSRNQDGEYCYHGRLDRMLKCSGYRVEPAEIETILNQIAGVQASAVIGINDASSGQRPAAVLVIKNQTLLADIARITKEKLPPYMMPCKFKVLAALPILSNGKTDYFALHSLFNDHD